MVAMTFRFKLLTTICVLAVSLVDGAAVPVRHKANSLSSKRFVQNSPPVLPLPPQSVKNRNTKKMEGEATVKFGKGKYHKQVLSDLDTVHNDPSSTASHRNGYRRESDGKVGGDRDLKVDRRSRMISLNVHGVPYVARRSNPNRQQVLEVKGDHVRKHVRRDSNNSDAGSGIPGRIDVVVIDSVNSTTQQLIAHLGLANSTGNSPFVINAQEPDADPTTFYMMTVRPAVVNLATQVYDMSTNTMSLWCATYNCSPPEPQSMTLQRCWNGSSTSSQESQEFEYNSITREVKPRQPANQTNSTSDDQATAAPSGTGITNGTSVNSGNSSNNSSFSARDAPAPQNVTLIFTPSVPTYSEVTSDSAVDPEDPSSSLTTMSTVTVTSTVSSTETDTITMTSVSSNTTSATPLPSPSDMDSSQAASMSSSIPEPTSGGALNVEVVGPAAETMASTNSYSSSTAPTPTSSSVDAEQIAASIAGSSSSATAASTLLPASDSQNDVVTPMIPFSST